MFSQENCNKIQKLFVNTKTAFQRGNFPNGEQFPAAYHTLNFGNIEIKGQRNNVMRVEILKKHFDFLVFINARSFNV